MHEQALEQWEREFRAAAKADGGAALDEHLQRLDLDGFYGRPLRPNETDLMLEATIDMVRMLSPYATMDGRDEDFIRFLDMQRYHFVEPSDERFVFTFNLCYAAYARLVVDHEGKLVDLADLYGTPWNSLRIAGYSQLWMSHVDWMPMTSETVAHLESIVTNDLRFDYGEEEVDFWFDDSLSEAYLLVTIQDAYDEEVED